MTNGKHEIFKFMRSPKKLIKSLNINANNKETPQYNDILSTIMKPSFYQITLREIFLLSPAMTVFQKKKSLKKDDQVISVPPRKQKTQKHLEQQTNKQKSS